MGRDHYNLQSYDNFPNAAKHQSKKLILSPSMRSCMDCREEKYPQQAISRSPTMCYLCTVNLAREPRRPHKESELVIS